MLAFHQPTTVDKEPQKALKKIERKASLFIFLSVFVFFSFVSPYIMTWFNFNHVVPDHKFLELFYVLELDLELGPLKVGIEYMDGLGG